MAAVYLWIQSGQEILILDCVRGDFSLSHVLQFLLTAVFVNYQAIGHEVHCGDTAGKRNHIPVCSSLTAKVCINFLSLGLLNISPANSLCHISLTRASSLSVLCLFVADMNCDTSRGSFTIPGDKEGFEQQSVSHILVSCKAETDSRVWIEPIASSLANTSCGRSCFGGLLRLPQGWTEKREKSPAASWWKCAHGAQSRLKLDIRGDGSKAGMHKMHHQYGSEDGNICYGKVKRR